MIEPHKDYEEELEMPQTLEFYRSMDLHLAFGFVFYCV